LRHDPRSAVRVCGAAGRPTGRPALLLHILELKTDSQAGVCRCLMNASGRFRPALKTRPGIDCRFPSPVLEKRRMQGGSTGVEKKSRSVFLTDTCESAPQTCFSFFFLHPAELRPSTQGGFRAGGSAPCQGAMPNYKVMTKPRQARRPAAGANGGTKYRGPWGAVPLPSRWAWAMACG
jgi:hypothetical protein